MIVSLPLASAAITARAARRYARMFFRTRGSACGRFAGIGKREHQVRTRALAGRSSVTWDRQSRKGARIAVRLQVRNALVADRHASNT